MEADPFRPSPLARIRFWHDASFIVGFVLFAGGILLFEYMTPAGVCFVASGVTAIIGRETLIRRRSLIAALLSDTQWAIVSGISLILFACLMFAIDLRSTELFRTFFSLFWHTP